MSRLLAILLLSLVVWTTGSHALTFTDNEQQWLKDHPELLLGIDTTWPPFEFRDQEGNYKGLAADYIQLISDRLGITFKPVAAPSWSEVLEQTKEGKIDLLPGIMSILPSLVCSSTSLQLGAATGLKVIPSRSLISCM